jgi:hypothetical protein
MIISRERTRLQKRLKSWKLPPAIEASGQDSEAEAEEGGRSGPRSRLTIEENRRRNFLLMPYICIIVLFFSIPI